MQDLVVNLGDMPGTLAHLGDVLGSAGINIEGVAGFGDARTGAHVLVQSAQQARDALEQADIACGGERDVEVIPIVDQPGEMGRHLRRVADAGINIDLVYMATNTRLVLGSPDMAGLRSALHGDM